MKLADYLAQEGLSEAAFAERIGVTQAAVNRYKKDRVPEPEPMRAIVAATGGAVQPNDFFDLPSEAA
jgi:predicted transcriptional regulator